MLNVMLTRRVETFVRTHPEWPASKIGRDCCRDPRMVSDLRAGTLGQKRQDKLAAWLTEKDG